MKRTSELNITLLVVLLSGCASTGIIPMDQDSYLIGKKDGTPGLGVSLSNKAEVYREANDFCRSKGLEVKTLQVTTTPARPAQLGSTELHFKCVAPGGTAQPLIREPDQIIENRIR
ncbi:MAG: hypothetical protein KGL90_14220 [Burkholderiales bacterium]|nr:hypothetical protein [Burkholderiales bacterium]